MEMGFTVHFNSELHSKKSNVHCATVALTVTTHTQKHSN